MADVLCRETWVPDSTQSLVHIMLVSSPSDGQVSLQPTTASIAPAEQVPTGPALHSELAFLPLPYEPQPSHLAAVSDPLPAAAVSQMPTNTWSTADEARQAEAWAAQQLAPDSDGLPDSPPLSEEPGPSHHEDNGVPSLFGQDLHVLGNAQIDGTLWAAQFLNLSDERLKHNITAADADALQKLQPLSPVAYTLQNSLVMQVGFLAQDVQKHIPEAVAVCHKTGALGINSNTMQAYSIQAIRQLHGASQSNNSQVVSLQQEVANLQAQMLRLQTGSHPQQHNSAHGTVPGSPASSHSSVPATNSEVDDLISCASSQSGGIALPMYDSDDFDSAESADMQYDTSEPAAKPFDAFPDAIDFMQHMMAALHEENVSVGTKCLKCIDTLGRQKVWECFQDALAVQTGISKATCSPIKHFIKQLRQKEQDTSIGYVLCNLVVLPVIVPLSRAVHASKPAACPAYLINRLTVQFQNLLMLALKLACKVHMSFLHT